MSPCAKIQMRLNSILLVQVKRENWHNSPTCKKGEGSLSDARIL